MNQLFAAYSRGRDARELSVILGESALSDLDKIYAHFSDEFEANYLNQSFTYSRDIEETMKIGWRLLRLLPSSELRRVNSKWIEKYYKNED